MIEMTRAEQFALEQLIERETAEQQALQAKFAARFGAFTTLVAEEHGVPLEYLRYGGGMFHDVRVEAAPAANGLVEAPVDEPVDVAD